MLIDPSRFVSKLEYSRVYPEMPYITLRPAFLAEQHFGADFITAACLVEHQAFYRRMFGGAPWREPRPYPNFKRPMAFIGHDCNALRETVYTRYPFYLSTDEEQLRLFSRSSNVEDAVERAIDREMVES